MQTKTQMQTQVQPQVQVQPQSQSQTQIQTYHFDEVVNSEGVITLSGLPPLEKVAVVVIHPTEFDWQEEIKLWIAEMKDHPFKKMSKEEILKCLRQSRDRIYEEDYGDRHVD